MSAESLWSAVRNHTLEIVQTNAFQRIAACVPYCENWWHSELAWRFDETPSRTNYRLVGFDVPIIPISGNGVQPDLLLDTSLNDTVCELVWLELKQLNLQRRIDPNDLDAKSRLKTALANSCKALCTAFERVRNIDLTRTATERFQDSRDLQQLTLLPIYRERPLELFRRADHLAAAFMLAAVPAEWSQSFSSTFSRSICRVSNTCASAFQRSELLREWDTKGSRIAVYLSCLVTTFACGDKKTVTAS